MTPNHNQSPSEPETPGADRFWGQVSQTGRSRKEEPEPDRDAESGPAGPREGTGQAGTDGGPIPDANGNQPEGHGECLEWCPICRSAELLRNAVTPELREQAESLQREAFSVFQSFLNSYADKTGGDTRKKQETSGEGNSKPGPGPGRDEEPEITEIPLD